MKKVVWIAMSAMLVSFLSTITKHEKILEAAECEK